MSDFANNTAEIGLNTSVDDATSLKDKLTVLLSFFKLSSGLSFRELMANTEAVISGSAALYMLHPKQFIPNDLDVYVLPDGFASVVIYILQHGYVLQPSDYGSSGYDEHHLLVFKLVHPLYEKSVNIVTAFENHVTKLITDFHSTIVMNYVSWFGLVCLYPTWTGERRGLVIKNTAKAAECHRKYEERGYTMSRKVAAFNPDHVCGVDPYCPETVRTLADGHSLIKLFEPEEDGFSDELPDYVSWSMGIQCDKKN